MSTGCVNLSQNPQLVRAARLGVVDGDHGTFFMQSNQCFFEKFCSNVSKQIAKYEYAFHLFDTNLILLQFNVTMVTNYFRFSILNRLPFSMY